ncbi:2-oxo acid dehydrogenase subunit E2 [Rhizobium leguminosarum]
MPIEVKMTSFSPEMRTAKVVRWWTELGEVVHSGDIIAEIESEKAVMDLLAPCDGILSQILVPAGDAVIDARTVIAQLLANGEVNSELPVSLADVEGEKTGSTLPTIDVLMPALAPSMESATLVRWLVSKADAVTVGSVIAEAETDKATLEIESAHSGVIEEIRVPAGTPDVPVNAVIAVIASAEIRPGSNEVSTAHDLPEVGALQVEETSRDVSATPLAKRTASQLGVDLSAVEGTGAKGRITKIDVEGNSRGTENGAPDDDTILRLFPSGSFQSVPHSNMRRTIARRLAESKRTVPHFYVSTDCRIDALLDIRKELNSASSPEGTPGAYRLTINDMVIRAHALALREFPAANVTWTDAAMLQHANVDISVAVALEGGLITPIIRNAESKPLSVISREVASLAARARSQELRPNEYEGGTTSISNLGMFGATSFAAVVNPPQATILAVGASQKRAIVHDDRVSSGNIMTVTLSTDHRAVDGALAAQVLKAFKHYLENPLSMMA